MATGVGKCTCWVSTCWVLVKNLKGSEFNVPVSETNTLGNIFMSSFFKREMAPQKVIGLLVGVPWPEIIMKHSVYIQVRFGS